MENSYTFTGRCPSYKQVLKKVIELYGIYDEFDVSWGENCITIMRLNNQMIGTGWIRSISGSDLAFDITH